MGSPFRKNHVERYSMKSQKTKQTKKDDSFQTSTAATASVPWVVRGRDVTHRIGHAHQGQVSCRLAALNLCPRPFVYFFPRNCSSNFDVTQATIIAVHSIF